MTPSYIIAAFIQLLSRYAGPCDVLPLPTPYVMEATNADQWHPVHYTEYMYGALIIRDAHPLSGGHIFTFYRDGWLLRDAPDMENLQTTDYIYPQRYPPSTCGLPVLDPNLDNLSPQPNA